MSRRDALHWVLISIAVAGCAARGSEPAVPAPRRYEAPPIDPDAPSRLVDPKRPTTIEAREFDPMGLPELERVTATDLPATTREAGRFQVNADGTVSFRGIDALDIEMGDARVLVANGDEPVGIPGGPIDQSRGSLPAVWRGPADAVAGGLRVVCFEGTFDPTSGIAEASRVYQVIAKAIVPDLVYAFRSGRPEADSIRAPERLVKPKVSADPCVGRAGVEIIGPSALWISASEQDPHDAVVVRCAGNCPFSRVVTPVERGNLSVSVLVTNDTANRIHLEGAPLDSNVFSYTFEIDWMTERARPSGRVFIAVESAPAERIRALGPEREYYFSE